MFPLSSSLRLHSWSKHSLVTAPHRLCLLTKIGVNIISWLSIAGATTGMEASRSVRHRLSRMLTIQAVLDQRCIGFDRLATRREMTTMAARPAGGWCVEAAHVARHDRVAG